MQTRLTYAEWFRRTERELKWKNSLIYRLLTTIGII